MLRKGDGAQSPPRLSIGRGTHFERPDYRRHKSYWEREVDAFIHRIDVNHQRTSSLGNANPFGRVPDFYETCVRTLCEFVPRSLDGRQPGSRFRRSFPQACGRKELQAERDNDRRDSQQDSVTSRLLVLDPHQDRARRIGNEGQSQDSHDKTEKYRLGPGKSPRHRSCHSDVFLESTQIRSLLDSSSHVTNSSSPCSFSAT